MKKILVCGDREWDDYETIRSELDKYGSAFLVIAGACRGADQMAAHVARTQSKHVAEVAALWPVFGSRAGIRRNLVMLDLKPDLVIAFHNDIASSKGTAHTIQEAKFRNIPVKIITSNPKGD